MKPGLLLLALLLVSSGPGGESEFERSLLSAKRLAQTKRWSQAMTELDRLLDSHENESYMLAHLSEVIDLYRRCSFFESSPSPSIQELVGGQVTEWNERTGQLGLTYTELTEDFVEDGDGILVHPVAFSGPYELELHGRMEAAPTDLQAAPRVPQVLVGIDGSASYQISYGYPSFEVDGREQWIPPRLVRHGAGPVRVLAEAPSVPLRFEERYELSVEVSATSVIAKVSGQPLLQASKSPELFGRVAVLDLPGTSRVSLRGQTDGAWLGRLRDEAHEAAWEEFRSGWRVEEQLPPWVAEHLLSSEAGPTSQPLRMRLPGAQLPALSELNEHMAERRYEEGLARLASFSRNDLEPGLRLFFEAMFQLALQHRSSALEAIDRSIRAQPEFFEARLLKGRILGELGREDETLALFDSLVAELPSEAVAWSEYASWCLRFGRPQEAQQVLAQALRAGIPSSELSEAESLASRALTGPLWERTFEYSSRNFTVRSDVDRQTCFDAAQELEAALRLYQLRLDRIGATARNNVKSPVYIFSGRASYESYAGDLFSNAPENTGGLFSPTLKQILAWIPEDPSELKKTLRHEGLHYFLDALLGRLPAWLNEGLAEYFENTELARGVPTLGHADAQHIRTLLEPGFEWLPYEQLFTSTDEEFYADSARMYAQSWAVVHWLQHSDSQKARLLQSYVKQLSRGFDSSQLTRTLLEIEDLGRRVERHVQKLAQKR